MSSILIYAVVFSPRSRYIFQEMFGRMLGLQPVFTCSPEEYQCHKGAKINYSSTALDEEEIQVFPYGILEEQGIKQDPDIDRLFEGTISFSLTVREKLVIGSRRLRIAQDIFSAAFYLLARYEEYLPFDADHHNRFSSGISVASRHGFLRKPIIQEWAVTFGELLLFFFPTHAVSRAKFQQLITIDIDQAFKYRNKSFLRTLGGILLNPRTFVERFRVLLGAKKDPFDSFDEMIQLFEDKKAVVLFFVLMGDNGAYDKNTDSRNVEFQKIIKLLDKKYTVGIHPSYASNQSENASALGQLEKEKKRLENIVQHPIENSRQHYLKLEFPVTYQRLLKAGIKADYSMGYADEIGYRASTGMPFFWFDLSQETSTSLLVHPFQCMDVTLKNYMQLSAEEASRQVTEMKKCAGVLGGEFALIWHNSSFDHEWEGWKLASFIDEA